MPRYDYECPECFEIIELVHSIRDCEEERRCPLCCSTLVRQISSPHVEGSYIYPFRFWNARLPGGAKSVEVNNRYEHRKLLESRGLDSPVIAKRKTKNSARRACVGEC